VRGFGSCIQWVYAHTHTCKHKTNRVRIICIYALYSLRAVAGARFDIVAIENNNILYQPSPLELTWRRPPVVTFSRLMCIGTTIIQNILCYYILNFYGVVHIPLPLSRHVTLTDFFYRAIIFQNCRNSYSDSRALSNTILRRR